MIGFLHTSPVHEPTFAALVRRLGSGIDSCARVNAALLDDATALGPRADVVVAGIGAALDELVDAGSDVIVCTCSTIGGIAESLGTDRGLMVLRVDRPMAQLAIASGPRIVVLAAVQSTLAPTEALLREVATEAGVAVEVEMVVVDGAWDRFSAGDHAGYLVSIADAITAVASRADVVVLAQASMAGAAELAATDVVVLSSPVPAVERAVALVRADPSARRPAGR